MFSKVAVLAVVVAVCAAVPSYTPNTPEWNAFKQQFGKQYVSPIEEWKRHIVFMSNLQLINEHNDRYAQGLETYAMAVNHLADLTLEEFQARNNYRMRPVVETEEEEVVGALPSTVDWRPKGYVTPVKDQKQCGSCWSFSATGSLEGQHFKATGKLVSLSEQNLVDCAHESYGCDGGWADAAFDYIIKNGIDTEQSYPYEARDASCRFKSSSVGATMKSYVDLKSGSESALQQASATVGPISVAIDASHISFQFYSHGIYSEPSCSTKRLDHAVLVVGYGTENGQDYWLVKNSWNTSWGDKGYIKMQRNHNNACGISTQAGYPKV